MFVINPLPPRIDPALIGRLSEAEPATIGHVRHVGFMAPEVKLQLPGYRRIAGTAVTVRAFADDTAIIHYALGQLRPGDVLVIDRAGDTRHACCGGGVAFSAKAAGCVGIIIDGPATDAQELRAYARLVARPVDDHLQARVPPGRFLRADFLRRGRGRAGGRDPGR